MGFTGSNTHRPVHPLKHRVDVGTVSRANKPVIPAQVVAVKHLDIADGYHHAILRNARLGILINALQHLRQDLNERPELLLHLRRARAMVPIAAVVGSVEALAHQLLVVRQHDVIQTQVDSHQLGLLIQQLPIRHFHRHIGTLHLRRIPVAGTTTANTGRLH